MGKTFIGSAAIIVALATVHINTGVLKEFVVELQGIILAPWAIGSGCWLRYRTSAANANKHDRVETRSINLTADLETEGAPLAPSPDTKT